MTPATAATLPVTLQPPLAPVDSPQVARRAQGTRADALFLPSASADSGNRFSASLARRLDNPVFEDTSRTTARGGSGSRGENALTQAPDQVEADATPSEQATAPSDEPPAESADEAATGVGSRDEASDNDNSENSDSAQGDATGSGSALGNADAAPAQPRTIHHVNESLLEQQDWAQEILLGSPQLSLGAAGHAHGHGANQRIAQRASGIAADSRIDDARAAARDERNALAADADQAQRADEEGGPLTQTATQRRSQAGWRSSPFEIDLAHRWREGYSTTSATAEHSTAAGASRADAASNPSAVGRTGAGAAGIAGDAAITNAAAATTLAGTARFQTSRADSEATAGGSSTNATNGSAKNAPKSERGAADSPSAVSPLRALEAQPGVRQLSARFGRPDVRTHTPHPSAAQQTPFDAQARAVRAQALRGVAAALSSSEQSVTLKLEPATLGELRVNLQFKEGTVAARFEATSSEARRLLERSIGDLRQALEARGVEVSQLDVQLVPPRDTQPTDTAQDAPNSWQDAGANAEAFNANPQGGASAGSQDSPTPRDGRRESLGLDAERSDLSMGAAVSDSDAHVSGDSQEITRLGLDALA